MSQKAHTRSGWALFIGAVVCAVACVVIVPFAIAGGETTTAITAGICLWTFVLQAVMIGSELR